MKNDGHGKKPISKIRKKQAEENAEGSSASFFEKTKERIVTAVDQNNDGRLNLKDISTVSRRLSKKRELNKREAEIQLLRPLFEDDLEAPGFNMPKMIRVVEMDKKHAESEVCIGSIGHESEYKGLRIVNIYPENISSFGLSFYPDSDNDVYYVDPCDRDHYIALDAYFNYLKVARVSELQRIAQDLGAKHFKVIYLEYSHSETKKQNVGHSNVKALSNIASSIDTQLAINESSSSKVEIAAEMECIGHKPVKPDLKYFSRDPQIQNLVSLRMSDNSITHQIFTLKMSTTSGIRLKDAANIDAALSNMKADINVSIEKEAKSENNRYFKYEIDF